MELYQVEETEWQKITKFYARFGKTIAIGVLAIACAFGGHSYYKHHLNVKREQASMLFEGMIKALRNQDIKTAESQAVILQAQFLNTPYAELSGLLLAKMAVEAQDLGSAERHLQFVLGLKKHGPTYHIAKVRLAKVLMAANKLEEAFALLKETSPPDYRTLYEEAKGDYYLAKGEIELARTAYQQAMEAAPNNAPMPWVQMKLNDLGKSKELS